MLCDIIRPHHIPGLPLAGEYFDVNDVLMAFQELKDVIKSLRPEDPDGVHPDYKINKESKKISSGCHQGLSFAGAFYNAIRCP